MFGTGHDHRRGNLDGAAKPLGQKIADFLFQFLGIQYFFITCFHGQNYKHLGPAISRRPARHLKKHGAIALVNKTGLRPGSGARNLHENTVRGIGGHRAFYELLQKIIHAF